VDWLEVGGEDKGVPQLNFKADYESDHFLYDIPFGSTVRSAMDFDVPGLSYACALPKAGPALAIVSRDKYGYRCRKEDMSLTLIRSSYNPDPLPELCRHNFTFFLAMPQQATAAYMRALSNRLCHPVFSQSVEGKKGELGAEYSMMECDGTVSSVKPAEDGSGDIIIRLYDDKGTAGDVSLRFPKAISKAYTCTLSENKLVDLEIIGKSVQVPMPKNGLVTVRVTIS